MVVALEGNVRQTATLSAQVAELVKELQTQLTRIAQIQAQLDHVTKGTFETKPQSGGLTDH